MHIKAASVRFEPGVITSCPIAMVPGYGVSITYLVIVDGVEGSKEVTCSVF